MDHKVAREESESGHGSRHVRDKSDRSDGRGEGDEREEVRDHFQARRKKNPSRLEVDVVEVVVHREISTTRERERGSNCRSITVSSPREIKFHSSRYRVWEN